LHLKKSEHFTFDTSQTSPLKKESINSYSWPKQSLVADNQMVNIRSEFNRRTLVAVDTLSKAIYQSSQKSSFGIIYSTPPLSARRADSGGSTKLDNKIMYD
jgi:hypothetical protein